MLHRKRHFAVMRRLSGFEIEGIWSKAGSPLVFVKCIPSGMKQSWHDRSALAADTGGTHLDDRCQHGPEEAESTSVLITSATGALYSLSSHVGNPYQYLRCHQYLQEGYSSTLP